MPCGCRAGGKSALDPCKKPPKLLNSMDQFAARVRGRPAQVTPTLSPNQCRPRRIASDFTEFLRSSRDIMQRNQRKTSNFIKRYLAKRCWTSRFRACFVTSYIVAAIDRANSKERGRNWSAGDKGMELDARVKISVPRLIIPH